MFIIVHGTFGTSLFVVPPCQNTGDIIRVRGTPGTVGTLHFAVVCLARVQEPFFRVNGTFGTVDTPLFAVIRKIQMTIIERVTAFIGTFLSFVWCTYRLFSFQLKLK